MAAFRRLWSGTAQMEQRKTLDAFDKRIGLLQTAFVLLLSTVAYSGSAQVIPQLKAPPRISVFSTYTSVKPDYQYYGDFAASGVTLGAFLQTRHVLGIEARASVLRWGGLEHEDSAGQPEPKLDEALGPQWSTVGGLDIYLQHNFVIRMGEISYSKTYLHGWTMTPLTASAGIVYRLR